jgi:hypothetical protein
VASFFHGKTPTMTGPTCNDMHDLINKCFNSRFELNLLNSSATAKFHIFNG